MGGLHLQFVSPPLTFRRDLITFRVISQRMFYVTPFISISIYSETTSMGIDICEFISHRKESHRRRGRKLSAPDVSDVSFPLVL